MNPLFIPTLLLAAGLFIAGWKTAAWNRSYAGNVVALFAALPAFTFALYYTGWLGEPQWLYWFRAQPYTELSAAGLGGLAGRLEFHRRQHPRLQRSVSAFFIPFLALLCLSAPYLKQVFLRPDWSHFEDRWEGEVCRQSTESSCGPAAAATFLRHFGIQATERTLAEESFTTRRGTENWYLLRTLHRHGSKARSVVLSPGLDHLQFPAIAGVKLKTLDNTGHFIALLGKQGDRFIIGEPVNGREELSRETLAERYTFTGFYIVAED